MKISMLSRKKKNNENQMRTEKKIEIQIHQRSIHFNESNSNEDEFRLCGKGEIHSR